LDHTVHISRAFSGRPHENLFGRAFEILEESWTQPSFHLPLRPPIPIAFVFGSSPNESDGVAWKGACREDDFESVCGVRDVCCQHIQNVVSAADKRLPHQAGSRVIEYPYPFQPVGENDTEGVHFLTVASRWAHMQVICRPIPPLCCLATNLKRSAILLLLLMPSPRPLLVHQNRKNSITSANDPKMK